MPTLLERPSCPDFWLCAFGTQPVLSGRGGDIPFSADSTIAQTRLFIDSGIVAHKRYLKDDLQSTDIDSLPDVAYLH